MNVRRFARTTLVLATAALTLGLSSCGFSRPTTMMYNPPVGVNELSSEVDVLNALIVKRESTSDSGTLVTSLSNNNDRRDDRLTGIEVGQQDAGVQVELGSSVDVPAGQLVRLSEDTPVEVTGEPVQDGVFVTLTYTFANARSVTVDVPVLIQGEGYFEDVPVS